MFQWNRSIIIDDDTEARRPDRFALLIYLHDTCAIIQIAKSSRLVTRLSKVERDGAISARLSSGSMFSVYAILLSNDGFKGRNVNEALPPWRGDKFREWKVNRDQNETCVCERFLPQDLMQQLGLFCRILSFCKRNDIHTYIHTYISRRERERENVIDAVLE